MEESKPTNLFELYRDGELLMVGTELDCINYVHQNHAFSFHEALTHQGFTWEPVKEEEGQP
jgi:hypothetical protein